MKEAAFEHNQPVHVVVEVRRHSEHGSPAHNPMRYIRLPGIGKNPALEELKAMAIRIEWVSRDSNGQEVWKTHYLDRTNLFQTDAELKVGAPPPSDLDIYQTAMGIWTDIHEINWTGANRPSWLIARCPRPVYRIEYDHLAQTLRERLVMPVNRVWPVDNTVQQNRARIVALFPPSQTVPLGPGGAHLQEVTVGRAPQSYGHRTKCDICYTLANDVSSCP